MPREQLPVLLLSVEKFLRYSTNLTKEKPPKLFSSFEGFAKPYDVFSKSHHPAIPSAPAN